MPSLEPEALTLRLVYDPSQGAKPLMYREERASIEADYDRFAVSLWKQPHCCYSMPCVAHEFMGTSEIK
jgi:hypothetical protein